MAVRLIAELYLFIEVTLEISFAKIETLLKFHQRSVHCLSCRESAETNA